MNITPFPTLSPATIDAINVIGQWLAQDDFSGEMPYQADCVILAGNAVMRLSTRHVRLPAISKFLY